MSEIPCSRPCSAQLVCHRVERHGVVYRCATALANAHGVTRGAVYQSLYRNGNANGVRNRHKGGGHRRPVQIGRYSWPTLTALALEIGVTRSSLYRLMASSPDALLAKVMEVKG